jgi:hypothetical protein
VNIWSAVFWKMIVVMLSICSEMWMELDIAAPYRGRRSRFDDLICCIGRGQHVRQGQSAGV